MKRLGRKETFEYLRDRLQAGKRIVVPRYGDGEYLLMTSGRSVAKENASKVGPLLKRSIKVKNQLVCTVDAADPSKGVWYRTCQYIMKEGGHGLYGTGSWIRWDFIRNNEALPFIFKGKVLVVAGYAAEAANMFKNIQPGVEAYPMPKNQASSKYEKASGDVKSICGNFDNILFACGPIGKVLLSDIVPLTKANLVDIGSLLPAILSRNDKKMLKTWTMGGYKRRPNLDTLIDNLLKKI